MAFKDKLQDFSQIAEIVGAIALIISLVFLTLELQENTTAQKRATYNQLTETIDNWRNNWSLNPETRNIVFRIQNGEEVTSEEMMVLVAIQNQIYSIYERAFWGNEYGQMGVSEWERFERMICNGRSGFWRDESAFLFTKEFVEFVRSCPTI